MSLSKKVKKVKAEIAAAAIAHNHYLGEWQWSEELNFWNLRCDGRGCHAFAQVTYDGIKRIAGFNEECEAHRFSTWQQSLREK